MAITYKVQPNFDSPAYRAYNDSDQPFALIWQRDGTWTAVDSETNSGYSATASTRGEAAALLLEMLSS
jgi:hypothetical protein